MNQVKTIFAICQTQLLKGDQPMNSQLKLLAAAVALAGSATAHAAMDNFISGNSSLAFVALDSVGSPISVMMDLDFRLDDFLPSNQGAAGTKIVWDFNQNRLTVNGVLSTSTQTNWSSALGTFQATANAGETKWAVIGGDSLSTASTSTPIRYLSTSTAPLTTLQNQTKFNLSGFSGVDSLYNANNLLQSAASGQNGSTATAGAAYVGTPDAFNVAGTWENKTIGWSAYALEGAAQSLYLLSTDNGISSTKALAVQYALANPTGPATFHYSSGVLTYSVPAPVPLPPAVGLMAAGLGLLGTLARRRAGQAG